MRIMLPLAIMWFACGCSKKIPKNIIESSIIERNMDILDEEDIEELPER